MMNKAFFLFFFLTGIAYAAYSPSTIITDPAGVNQATVKAASTAPSATDKALVVAMSPNASCSVTGTFWQATQPVSASSLPLPTGAATAAKQPALGTAGSASTDVITVQGIASMTALKVDGSAVTQPVSGTVTVNALTNSSVVKAQLQDNAGTAVTVGQKTMSASLPIAIASDQGSVPTKAPVNANGSGSAAAATVSTVITLTAPANAVGFILQNLDTSTANVRWAVGRTATATLGQQLQPGRDTGFIPGGANVSLVAESGTQNYDVQWVSQ